MPNKAEKRIKELEAEALRLDLINGAYRESTTGGLYPIDISPDTAVIKRHEEYLKKHSK